jgi:hypothetical protein
MMESIERDVKQVIAGPIPHEFLMLLFIAVLIAGVTQ